MNRTRVVVCGTTFGRVYVAGVRRLPEHYELVGILSRGSEQSRAFASRQRLPLFTTIEELPEFDMACVVVRSGIVGGKGSQLARRFLADGRHVVLEHPIHRDDAVECYREAARSGGAFFINPFYRHSPTIASYLKMARVLREDHGILGVEAECSIHFLFSMIDLVGRITGGFTPWEIQAQGTVAGVLTQLGGSFRGVPVSLRVVNRMNPLNPDDFAHVGHRITVFTVTGNLVLTETDGQIIWHPNVTTPRTTDGLLEIEADEALSTVRLHESLAVETEVTRRCQFERIWPSAVAGFLDALRQETGSPAARAREAEYMLTLCAVWAHAGQLMGPAEPLGAETPPRFLSLAHLMERMPDGAPR